MIECQNCGEPVTEDYARVFTPNGVDAPRVCPHCPDRVRHGAEPAVPGNRDVGGVGDAD